MTRHLNLYGLLAAMTVLAAASAAAGGDIRITWFSVDGGGGASTNAAGSIFVRGAIGQADAGPLAGESIQMSGGVLAPPLPPPEPPCPTDITGDQVVDVEDLVLVILGWGTCGPTCQADLNDDGSVDVQDLVQVVLNWGPCP